MLERYQVPIQYLNEPPTERQNVAVEVARTGSG